MSEEEINEIIKDFMELKEIHSSDSLRKSYLSIYKEAIQGLLDLYNKEKEKNASLQKEIENLKELMTHKNGYTKQLEEDLFENASNYVVSKDKIREKIKEYKGLKEIDKMAYEEQIKPLQELLEEE